MQRVHLLIKDLFLPKDLGASEGLQLPALESMLACGRREIHQASSFEQALSRIFNVEGGLAPICAAFEQLSPGCWLRADPVYVRLHRDQLLLLPGVEIAEEESMQLCASLNEHFSGQGMEFFAPHPNRWYLRLKEMPAITTVPLSQAAGRNIYINLPRGIDQGRWHGIFNEIQMLLFAHPVNEMREARGEEPVNSVWFWGEGCMASAALPGMHASADETLVEMLASAAGIPFSVWQSAWCNQERDELLVFTELSNCLQRGDLDAWRSSLQNFETGYAQPLWRALRMGKIALSLDLLTDGGMLQITLMRGDAWSFWRRRKRLAEFALRTSNL
jgi:hypothetical protein